MICKQFVIQQERGWIRNFLKLFAFDLIKLMKFVFPHISLFFVFPAKWILSCLQAIAHIWFNLSVIVESLTSHIFFERTKVMKTAGDAQMFSSRVFQFLLSQDCCLQTVLREYSSISQISHIVCGDTPTQYSSKFCSRDCEKKKGVAMTLWTESHDLALTGI